MATASIVDTINNLDGAAAALNHAAATRSSHQQPPTSPAAATSSLNTSTAVDQVNAAVLPQPAVIASAGKASTEPCLPITTAPTHIVDSPQYEHEQIRVLPPLPQSVIDSYQQVDQWISDNEASPAAASAALASPPHNVEVMRVNQLDAELLDGELSQMLAAQYKRIFKYFKTEVVSHYAIEFDTLLSYLIYRYTVLNNTSTPGNKLQNLILRSEVKPSNYHIAIDPNIDTRSLQSTNSISQQILYYPLSKGQKYSYLLWNVIGRYAWLKFNHYMTIHSWGAYPQGDYHRTVYQVVQRVDTVYQTLNLCNFVTFLYSGRYRTLIERLLRLRLVYIRSRVGRQISFEFMNQQLAWQTLIEFFMYVFPLLNLHKLRSVISGLFMFGNQRQPSELQTDSCPVCAAAPIHIPYVASCGCLYCYYCLASNRLANSRYVCNRCAHVVNGMKIWSADEHGSERPLAAG